jgi:ketosteroid isomerase-like protein
MTDPAVEQEIVHLARAWMEAAQHRDRAGLERTLAEDFLIAGWRPDGQLADRAAYIEDCLRPVDVAQGSYRYDQWNVRAYGDVTLANCVLHLHALVAGQQWGGAFLLTQVWVRKAAGWQVVTCHSSPVVDAQGKPMS